MTDKLVTPYSNRITIAKAINALASGEAGGGDGVDFTPAEKTKLAGIEKDSTKNRADSANADKVHKHALADVTGLVAKITELESRLDALEAAGV